jgi:hypothetical protein
LHKDQIFIQICIENRQAAVARNCVSAATDCSTLAIQIQLRPLPVLTERLLGPNVAGSGQKEIPHGRIGVALDVSTGRSRPPRG